MSTTTRTLPELPYTASSGIDCVAQAETLAELLAALEQIFDPWTGQDCVLWWRNLVVGIFTNEGKRLELLRPARADDGKPQPAA
jgi:hypothetical protein